MKSPIKELEAKGRETKVASRQMAYLLSEVKNKALHNISDDLLVKYFYQHEEAPILWI